MTMNNKQYLEIVKQVSTLDELIDIIKNFIQIFFNCKFIIAKCGEIPIFAAEFDVLKEMNIHLVIHLDPVETDNPKIDEIKAMVNTILQAKRPDISMHDFRVVFGDTHTNLIFDVVIPYGSKLTEFAIKKDFDMRMANHFENVFTVITFDRSYV